MAINNPLIPGDPYSYDLKWIIAKLKEYGQSITALYAQIPDEDNLKDLIASMIDSGEINTLILAECGIFNVKDYGAIGNGINDDLSAIESAYTAAQAANGILYFPEGTYFISDTLVLPDPVHVCMIGEIYYSGNGTAVKVGQNSTSYNGAVQNWKIRGISAINTGSVGLYLLNCNTSKIYLENISLFETCVKCEGNGAGFQNNNILIGTIGQFTYGLVLTEDNSGWANENLFLGGRFFNPSSHTWTSYAIVLTSVSHTRFCNNNVFIKPNLERNTVGISLQYAKWNHFHDVRTEGVTTAATFNGSNTQNNDIKIGYGNLSSSMLSSLNKLESSRIDENRKWHTVKCYQFNDLLKNSACNASQGSVKNLYEYQGAGLLNPNAGNMRFTIGTKGIVIPGGRFYVAAFKVRPFAGRSVLITPMIETGAVRGLAYFYDASGNNITTVPEFFENMSWSSFASGNETAFHTSAAESFFVGIPSEAAEMRVGFQTTGSTEFIGMTIETDAIVDLITHEVILNAIPSIPGTSVGQHAYGTNGDIYTWDGSSWKTCASA